MQKKQAWVTSVDVHQPGQVLQKQWLPYHMVDWDFRSTSSQPVENLGSQK